MVLTIGQICVLSANLAPESYCDFLLDVDRRQFVAVALEQSCEKQTCRAGQSNLSCLFPNPKNRIGQTQGVSSDMRNGETSWTHSVKSSVFCNARQHNSKYFGWVRMFSIVLAGLSTDLTQKVRHSERSKLYQFFWQHKIMLFCYARRLSSNFMMSEAPKANRDQ